MNDILQRLYHKGLSLEQNRCSEQLAQFYEVCDIQYEQLLEMLQEQEKKKFVLYVQNSKSATELMGKEHFISGFKLGAQFALAISTE